MKKPWFIWLSLFGFIAYFISNAYKTVFCVKPLPLSAWGRLCAKASVLFLCFFLLPVILSLLIANLIGMASAFLGECFLLVAWILFYFCGVYITQKLYAWNTAAS